MNEVIHHIVPTADWDKGQNDNVYEPESLKSEGFIHFSTAEQLPATSLRYYRDEAELLVISVAVDAIAEGQLRWEDLAGSGEFPHLYGPLPLHAVLAVSAYAAGDPAPPS